MVTLSSVDKNRSTTGGQSPTMTTTGDLLNSLYWERTDYIWTQNLERLQNPRPCFADFMDGRVADV